MIVVIRCPEVRHEQFGEPRVPVSLPKQPNLEDEKQKDQLVLHFLLAYAELRNTQGGAPLPTGVDPEWVLTEVEAEEMDRKIGADLCLSLTRTSPLVIPDAGRPRLDGVPALPGEVDKPVALPAVSPVLEPGAVPPPTVTGSAPPTFAAAPCGGPICAVINGVEAHAENCPARGHG